MLKFCCESVNELSGRKTIIARYVSRGERFEILVDPHLAWKFKRGEPVDLNDILISDIIYK
ncbi:MAG TPA: hypothetical protein ENG81_05835, partial [Candidatus Bathyarchaeota archaeon]|nr:hypothetical protein [Candidatus Bathyarchaeota archaeon]